MQRFWGFLAPRRGRGALCRRTCTGSLVLGAAGLLRGKRAGTHWMSRELLRAFGAEPVAERVVIDGNIFTGGGVTAGIDVALTVAAEISGRAGGRSDPTRHRIRPGAALRLRFSRNSRSRGIGADPRPQRTASARPRRTSRPRGESARLMTQDTASYQGFVDELFRLGLVDAEKRDFLHRGLVATAGSPPAPFTKPTAARHRASQQAAERAAAAGRTRTDSTLRIGSGPETVHWGYFSGALDPIAFVRPGETVTIDTVSHEAWSLIRAPPKHFFRPFRHSARTGSGRPCRRYLLQGSARGLGPHIVSGPLDVEGAEPGDVLAVPHPSKQRGAPLTASIRSHDKGWATGRTHPTRSIVTRFDLLSVAGRYCSGIEVPRSRFRDHGDRGRQAVSGAV